ncbi:MAG: hypothetical protein WDN45_14650 [Caulobacteraceae bacterium]
MSARQAEVAEAVIEAEAERLGAPLRLMGRDFDAWTDSGRLLYQDETRLLDLPMPSLFGPHQVDNAGLAVAGALALGDARITETALDKGVSSAEWPARMQRLTAGAYGEMAKARGSDLWLDGGHNPHGARAVAEALAGLAKDGRSVALVAGTLSNKDAVGFFSRLQGPGPPGSTPPASKPTRPRRRRRSWTRPARRGWRRKPAALPKTQFGAPWLSKARRRMC